MHINISPSAPIDATYLTQSANGVLTAEAVLTAGTNITLTPGAGILTIDAAAGGSSLPVVDETAIVYKTGNVAITQTHDINAYTVARLVTWPDAALTVAGLQVANVFTAAQTMPQALLTSTSTTSAASTLHAFQAGLTSSNNTIISLNRVQARLNGAVTQLELNPGGGAVNVSERLIAATLRATDIAAITLAGTVHALQTGLSNSTNIAIDTTSIQSRNNGAAATLNLNSLGGNVSIGSGSSVTIAGDLTIQDKTDLTKQVRFSLSGISTGTTRVMTIPNLTSTIAVRDTNNAFLADQTVFGNMTVTSGLFLTGTNLSQKFAVQDSTGTSVFLVDTVAKNTSFFTMIAGTGGITNSLQVFHSSSGGGTVDGFGANLRFVLETSVNDSNQDAGGIKWLWATATAASRKARSIWSAFDTAEREGIRIEASGTAPMLGVLGAAAIVRQAHIADPGGGGTQDAEARTAINSILLALENFGFLATS